ncbi:conserved hypothetical protein [Chlorobaculum parvum NCIB 8327]|uniref:Zeta toxin domain-containing protein n=1 Tax=Chlorobaculum parvum (strain DSM 263 / NCIMB 8327) TaxID=517417 RepID=B3QQY8_CHLP8|nr:zeta toxin family protein [Chlorobaculum parvum]ACF10642.1 conserved hypothetical protein [Chlorobaculum parvum NCIB 8327]
MPTCWIFAGPNGAGKTTFAEDFLSNVPDCSCFLNADSIAQELSSEAPDRKPLTSVGRLFFDQMDQCTKNRKNFAFETTLSGQSTVKRVERLQGEGWYVLLIYLALPSVEMSILRVAERVEHGGHNIPKSVIERRFPRSLQNLFKVFSHRVNHCFCFMNHGKKPELIFEQDRSVRSIIHRDYYQVLLEEALL